MAVSGIPTGLCSGSDALRELHDTIHQARDEALILIIPKT